MGPPRDFHRTKGVKHSKDRKLPKEAVKNRTAEMAKARRKQAKATYNGPREAYWPDQETIDWETAYEMYLEDLCYTDGQRALAEQAVHDWYKNAFMADDITSEIGSLRMISAGIMSDVGADDSRSG